MNYSLIHNKMKVFKIIFTVLLLAIFSVGYAQDTRLSSYTFGEGYNFSNSNGSTVKLQGYIQPFMDAEMYNNSDQANAVRYRMSRLRLRLSGNSANERFG